MEKRKATSSSKRLNVSLWMYFFCSAYLNREVFKGGLKCLGGPTAPFHWPMTIRGDSSTVGVPFVPH